MQAAARTAAADAAQASDLVNRTSGAADAQERSGHYAAACPLTLPLCSDCLATSPWAACWSSSWCIHHWPSSTPDWPAREQAQGPGPGRRHYCANLIQCPCSHCHHGHSQPLGQISAPWTVLVHRSATAPQPQLPQADHALPWVVLHQAQRSCCHQGEAVVELSSCCSVFFVDGRRSLCSWPQVQQGAYYCALAGAARRLSAAGKLLLCPPLYGFMSRLSCTVHELLTH